MKDDLSDDPCDPPEVRLAKARRRADYVIRQMHRFGPTNRITVIRTQRGELAALLRDPAFAGMTVEALLADPAFTNTDYVPEAPTPGAAAGIPPRSTTRRAKKQVTQTKLAATIARYEAAHPDAPYADTVKQIMQETGAARAAIRAAMPPRKRGRRSRGSTSHK